MLNTNLGRGKFRNLHGRYLRRIRIDLYDMSQVEFARKLGCSPATVSQMELGKRELTPAAKELLDKEDIEHRTRF